MSHNYVNIGGKGDTRDRRMRKSFNQHTWC